jgi:hypothetical protein
MITVIVVLVAVNTTTIYYFINAVPKKNVFKHKITSLLLGKFYRKRKSIKKKSEIRNQKSEIRNQKSEIRNQKSEIRNKINIK